MKANEFVKKHGISVASDLVNASEWSLKQVALSTTTSMLDLRRLVESHELVAAYGGLLRAKSHYEKYKAMGSESNIILFSAIADVESINEYSRGSET